MLLQIADPDCAGRDEGRPGAGDIGRRERRRIAAKLGVARRQPAAILNCHAAAVFEELAIRPQRVRSGDQRLGYRRTIVSRRRSYRDVERCDPAAAIDRDRTGIVTGARPG